jgi:hypothetical protein
MGGTELNQNTLTVNYNGLVGVNTVGIPDAELHVNGQVKINDGTQAEGKVLTSDANGLASWQPANTPAYLVSTHYGNPTLFMNPNVAYTMDFSNFQY